MVNYIFLDIDGVLNSEAMCHHNPHPTCHGLMGIENNKVKLLKQIVNETDAKIVLVSSWKKSFDAFKRNGYKAIQIDGNWYTEELAPCGIFGKYLSNKLAKQKLRVYDTTTRYEKDPSYRGDGILAYLKENPANNYVILDDENFIDYQDRPAIQDHLVLTDWLVGLTEKDIEKALIILKNN